MHISQRYMELIRNQNFEENTVSIILRTLETIVVFSFCFISFFLFLINVLHLEHRVVTAPFNTATLILRPGFLDPNKNLLSHLFIKKKT